MMNRLLSFQVMIFLPFALALPGTALATQHVSEHDRIMREHMAPAQEPELKTLDDFVQEITALRQRVSALEALKPTFTNFMPDFSERFHVMHRAGDAGDWAVAAHEIAEMIRLMRVAKYIDPKLGSLMQDFMDGNLKNLQEAIEHGNKKSFRAAMKNTVESCNGCHAAAESKIVVSLSADERLSMRHPHALRKSTVPKHHKH